ADAAHVVVPVDELLQDHRLQAGLVVGGDELFDRVDDEDVFPPAAGVRLEHGGEARVRNQVLPVERKLQVAQRLHVVDGGNVLLVRQDDGLRNRHAQLPG